MRILERGTKFLMAFLFVAGISLAGSDGVWFPWPNLAGVALVILEFGFWNADLKGKP